jgi:peptide/nickel transport system substrate-binding protein
MLPLAHVTAVTGPSTNRYSGPPGRLSDAPGGTLRARPAGLSASSRLLRLLALLLSLMLVAAACGGDDGGGDTAEGGGDNQTEEEPEGEPRPGGKMVIGLEAESDGFDPTKNRFAVAGLTVANAVFDPLIAQNDEGEFVPYLAESMEPNDDHTVWTMTLREGVTFHDGTPLNADAVKQNMDAHKASALTAPALRMLDAVDVVDERTVTFTMSGSWVMFPSYLTGQLGFVAAPSMLASEEGPRNPVGTGPFVFSEWVPGQRWVGTKNADYWRADEGLPYLDEVEFRPIIEAQSRVNALLTGEIDVLHTSDIEAIQALRDAGDQISTKELTEGPTEENFILLNTAIPPFDNVHARRALSLATDRERIIQVLDRGIAEQATGPFSGQEDYPEPEGGYQHYDPEAAKEEIEAYKADTGESSLSFAYSTTNTGRSLQTAQLLQDMWSEVGIDVDIRQVEQSQFILTAILGDFQANGWRQHGAPDPDQDVVWWDIDNAGTVGEFSLNFGRYENEQLQEVLFDARGTADRDERLAKYGEVAQIFADEVPFVYTTRTLWVYGFGTDVGGVGAGFPLPGGGGGGGDPLSGVIRAGALYFTE